MKGNHAHADATDWEDLPPIEEYVVRKVFRRKYPDAHSSDQALGDELKKRHKNGMDQFHVVLEKFSGSDRQKPTLLIHPGRYFEWLRWCVRKGRGTA
jgi:hypothetical protein